MQTKVANTFNDSKTPHRLAGSDLQIPSFQRKNCRPLHHRLENYGSTNCPTDRQS